MKRSIIRNFLLYSIAFGFLMGVIFRLVTPFFVSFRSDLLNAFFTIMCIVAGLIVGIISYLIGKLILIKIIHQVKIYTQDLLDGKFCKTIQIDSDDELGDLANSLNQMVEKLREILISINVGAEEIVFTSQQISLGAQRLSAGAKTQASAAQEISTSLAQMAFNIQQNTENAIQQISSNAKQSIDLMGKSAKESIISIKEIAEKISIIKGISFQINILALNAAVESARAGQHGKGFAVVAAEVRKLAEGSKKASEEIAAITGKSIVVTEESDKLVNELIPEIEKTAIQVKKMAVTGNKQKSEVEQVNFALKELNQVIQQNMDASFALTANAEEFESKAEYLKNLIGYFKVDEK